MDVLRHAVLPSLNDITNCGKSPMLTKRGAILMISSAVEFARLRVSDDPAKQTRATREAMVDDALWQDVLRDFPDRTTWVIHNKMVPLAILQGLAHHADARIRRDVARKRKLDADAIALLEGDHDENVRAQIAQTLQHKGKPKC
jgi:hypothetical protein